MGWSARHKIAIGIARGLRYLHEDCRVGCIVHRDLRPNNILLTHDFEPMVSTCCKKVIFGSVTGSFGGMVDFLCRFVLKKDFVIIDTQVGDFGLARWQPDGHCGVETRVIGTFGYMIIIIILAVDESESNLFLSAYYTVLCLLKFGMFFRYLAPEYTQHGQITDRADVYSFGVVLLELITGRKAIDINRSKGEQCLTEWVI